MTATVTPRMASEADPAQQIVVKVDGTVITSPIGVTGMEILSQPGPGSFTLDRYDTQNSLCTIGAEVSYHLGAADIGWWTIREYNDDVIDPDEEAREVCVYSGESFTLKDGIVYPSKGIYTVTAPPYLAGLRVTTKPFSTDRALGWMEPSYDDSAWGAAVEVLDPVGSFRPEGHPDKAGKWIWYEAAVSSAHPVGSVGLFRKSFTTISSLVFAVKQWLAALDSVEAYLDGELICKTDPAIDSDVGQLCREIVTEINGAFPHVLAIKVEHTKPGLAGLLTAVYEHKTLNVLARTNSGWKAIDASLLPNMTPGSVQGQLIDEVQARGTGPLTDVTRSFTDTVDTRGSNWPSIVGDFSVRVMDELDLVQDQLAESYCEWAFLPADGGRELSMWVAPGLAIPGGGTGTGRGSASGVVFAEGVNCTALAYSEADEIKNVGLIFWDGGYLEGAIDTSVTAHGRREAGISLGNVKSGPSAIWTAYATLTPIAIPSNSVVIAIAPEDLTDQPYTAFNVGDTITAPNRAGVATDYRVQSIGFLIDPDGYLVWYIEVGTARDLEEQRQNRWLRRTANGTLDGRSKSATPSSPSIVNAGKTNVIEIPFGTGGNNEALIGDRGNPYIPREQIIIYRALIDADVAGVTAATSARIYIDLAAGETVTCPVSLAEGTLDLVTPILVDPRQQVNAEITAEGGHTGVTVTLLAVPTQ